MADKQASPASAAPPDAESLRLAQDAQRTLNWKRWGPYLSERQWGTVREDYSDNGDCWNYLPHDHARSRAYRWGEDGLLGICDRQGRLCFALALWNEKDPILKERLFGLTGPEGNHGEDVKEHYFYTDSTPTHSYMKGLYKYPQAEFPYNRLCEENRRRSRFEPEFEIADTGVFNKGRYFDVEVEYAKAGPDDIVIRITASNRGDTDAPLHLLPTLWFRNTWSWKCGHEGCSDKPVIRQREDGSILAEHPELGAYVLSILDEPVLDPNPLWLFTDNNTNMQRLYGAPNNGYVKDAFHECVVRADHNAVNPAKMGSKAAPWFRLYIPARASSTVTLRLCALSREKTPIDAREILNARRAESDAFYASRGLERMTPAQQAAARQAYAGLLWSKQFYHYIIKDWLAGDPAHPAPPDCRKAGRNNDWPHLFNRDVISMPDKWEYPWYAAWDLAFHMIAMAKVDGQFAKDQLLLFLREWYMHPSGQIPAYEFALSDVNPPVHAWAVWRVYKMTAPAGGRDHDFLARCFQKLLLNFTWWVNRKDPSGKNIFAGGFLGMDNVGVFDRSRPLPTGGSLEQADGTAWMAFYCGTMLSMALELAAHDPVYEDLASKFFEHFIAITDAMNTLGGTGLWDDADGFYYDNLSLNGATIPLKVRSMVGLVPLLAVEVLEEDTIARLPGFKKRLEWFFENRKDLSRHISYFVSESECKLAAAGKPAERSCSCNHHEHRLLAIPSRDRLVRVLKYLLDETEFLSPFGIRSLSMVHKDQPYHFHVGGEDFRVDYTPGESVTPLFGGNSNWRGPIWFPINFLLVEALERYHHFYGDDFKVECPTNSGNFVTLDKAADEVRRRLCSLFMPDDTGVRPNIAHDPFLASDPHSKDLVLFHEHFHADTGRGLGATHQTGWTALVAVLLQDLAKRAPAPPPVPPPPRAGVKPRVIR